MNITPRKVYRVYLGKIDVVTVISEAPQYIRLEVTGAFGTATVERAKKGGWQAKIYETWEDAHARLIEECEARVGHQSEVLDRELDYLEKARALVKP